MEEREKAIEWSPARGHTLVGFYIDYSASD
jgi:hypothetical protein